MTDDDRDESTQETRVGGHTIPEESAAAERETAVGHSVVEEPEADATAEPEADAAAEEVVESEPAPPPTPTAPPVTPPSTSSFGGGDAAGGGTSPAAADRAAVDAAGGGDRPELLVAGAFVGAFVFAKLLKRLGGSD